MHVNYCSIFVNEHDKIIFITLSREKRGGKCPPSHPSTINGNLVQKVSLVFALQL